MKEVNPTAHYVLLLECYTVPLREFSICLLGGFEVIEKHENGNATVLIMEAGVERPLVVPAARIHGWIEPGTFKPHNAPASIVWSLKDLKGRRS